MLKTLKVNGRKIAVGIPYDTHCDECSQHLLPPDRVGMCNLFKKRPLVCECGAPARLPECRAAECDGPCPECQGDGEIHFYTAPKYDEPQVETCTRCNGTGRI
jgi:DnaJ-class molecular chaperone